MRIRSQVRFGAEAETNDAHGVTGRDQWWRKQQRETNDNDTTPVSSTKNGCALRSVQEDSHSLTTLASWRTANFKHTVLQKKRKEKKKERKASSMSTKSIPAHHSSKPLIHRHYHSMNPAWRRCPAYHNGNQPATQWRDPNQTPVSQPASRVVPKAAAKRLSDILSNLGDTYVAHEGELVGEGYARGAKPR